MMEPLNKYLVEPNDELRVLYASYRPGPPLNDFIDYLWLIEGGQSAAAGKDPAMRDE